MASTTIEKYLQQARQAGIDVYSKQSLKWFQSQLKTVTTTPTMLFNGEEQNMVDTWKEVGAGTLHLAYYDPKHKDTLPFYDRFPLILPYQFYEDGFLALNFHYLPPILRAKVLDIMLDDNLNVNLAALFKTKYFEPCIKRYLGRHFRSRFLVVPKEAWPIVTFLPVERFEKADKETVWAHSRGRM